MKVYVVMAEPDEYIIGVFSSLEKAKKCRDDTSFSTPDMYVSAEIYQYELDNETHYPYPYPLKIIELNQRDYTMIDINKKYKTRDGREVRIYATDGCGAFPVHGAIKRDDGWSAPLVWTEDGKFNLDVDEKPMDLVEVSEWDDFKIDDPVMVARMGNDLSEISGWSKRYFAGVSKLGKPETFIDGATAWSSHGKIEWDLCRRPTPEELGWSHE